MAHKGRQGSGAADGSDINRVAPAGLAEPSVLCRRTVVLLSSPSAPRGLPKSFSISYRLFRLHRSSGSQACRILPEEEEVSCARNGQRCLQRRGWQGTTDPSMLLPALPPPPPPQLAGRRQGCCRRNWSRHPRGMSRGARGHGAGSPAAGEALEGVPEHPMLRRPDWKRTRQACGSSWRLIPLCPGKRG